MYEIDDKMSIVKDIKKFLKLISAERNDPRIDPLSRNGVFDIDTAEAVKYFQESEGLEPSGIVDEITFYKICDAYTYHYNQADKREKYPINIMFPIGYGTSHRDMVKINTMLYDVSEYYYGVSNVTKNSYFSKNTEVAVNALYEAFGLEGEDLISEEFYFKLSDEANEIAKYNKNADTLF